MGFALFFESDYNIDKCEENPGTHQAVSDEAVFTKQDSGKHEREGKKCPSGGAGFHLLTCDNKHDYKYYQYNNGNQDICIL